MIKRLILNLIFSLPFIAIEYFVFSPIYLLKTVYINYGLKPYNICEKQPELWTSLKILFIISSIFNTLIFANIIYSKICKTNKSKQSKKNQSNQPIKVDKDNLQLLIGKTNSNELITIPERGLYQNMLITGTIGSGKTSSAMYPFTKQLIYYKHSNPLEQIGMLQFQ